MELLHTRICDTLGIKYPIIQGPMDWIAGAQLAAAVSNAGGLGVLGRAVGRETMEAKAYTLAGLRSAIREVRSLTDKPFATYHGATIDPEWSDLIVEEGVPIIFTVGGHPGNSTEYYKKRGLKVVHMGSSVKHARTSEEAGTDAFIFAGFEGGGHDPGGHDRITTFAGIPQIVDAVNIPVIAAGGTADGRGLVAALALGAHAVRMGTRFAATWEATNHLNHKMAIVQATDTGTIHRGQLWEDNLRSLKNPYSLGLQELERRSASIEEISSYIGGKETTAHIVDPGSSFIRESTLRRRIRGQVDGDVVEGEIHAGQIAGLVKEILPATEVVRRIVEEAENILRGLAGRVQAAT